MPFVFSTDQTKRLDYLLLTTAQITAAKQSSPKATTVEYAALCVHTCPCSCSTLAKTNHFSVYGNHDDAKISNKVLTRSIKHDKNGRICSYVFIKSWVCQVHDILWLLSPGRFWLGFLWWHWTARRNITVIQTQTNSCFLSCLNDFHFCPSPFHTSNWHGRVSANIWISQNSQEFVCNLLPYKIHKPIFGVLSSIFELHLPISWKDTTQKYVQKRCVHKAQRCFCFCVFVWCVSFATTFITKETRANVYNELNWLFYGNWKFKNTYVK